MEGNDPTGHRDSVSATSGRSHASQSSGTTNTNPPVTGNDQSRPSNGTQLFSRPHRSALFSSGYTRSISLPQALHSFSLGNRNGGSSKSNKRQGQSTNVASTSSTSNSFSAAGSAETSSDCIRQISDPSSSTSFASSDAHSAAAQAEGDTSIESVESDRPLSSMRPQSRVSSNRVVSDASSRNLPFVPSFGSRTHRPLTRSETDDVRSSNYSCGNDADLLREPASAAATSDASSNESIRSKRLNSKNLQVPVSSFEEACENLNTLEGHDSCGTGDAYDVFYDVTNSQADSKDHALHCGSGIVGTFASPIRQQSAVQQALSNPDILHCISNALDAMSVIPREVVSQRRKPLSLRHAQLIFGDDKEAWEAWQNSRGSTTTEAEGSGLYNCLSVNSTWYETAVRILEARIHFSDNEHFTQFTRRGVHHLSRKPRMLVLHKLNEVTQVESDLIDSQKLGEELEWLEFYTCSGSAPTPSSLGSSLQRIILPGCFRVSDRTLAHIGEKCPRLEHLDIRACEQVSDKGIKIIAKLCSQLQSSNVGRNRGGELITYKGIKHLARQTQITTLGIAGCYIDDRAIWELALNRGPHIQRLSSNNCHLLTDASIPRVLGYMPNLNVLEIRGCTNITHMRPLAIYRAYREKQGQIPLIEGCEVIERRSQVAIMRLQRETSRRVLSDLTTFINSEEL